MIAALLALVVSAFAAPEDEAVWEAYKNDKPLTARRLAEERLAENPKSIESHHVLGMVLFYEEGSLAQARSHLHLALKYYEDEYPALNTNDVPWKLHSDILWQIQNLAGQMEEYEYELEIQARYNELYNPDLVAEAGWALMKLGRYEEAREAAQRGIDDTESRWQQSSGLNTLCALEGKNHNRQGNYDACLRALEHEYKDESPDVTVDANNTALAAYNVLRFDLVESHAKEATAGGAGGSSNPWGNLVYLYLSSARGADAVTALKEMQRWRTRMPANMRAQTRAGMDVQIAELLLVAGEGDKALAAIDRAVEFPDRRGSTSGDANQARGGHAALRISIREVANMRAAEEVSSAWLPERILAWAANQFPDVTDWEDRATVAGVATQDQLLFNTLRIHVNDALAIPTWMIGDLVELVGPGIVMSALKDVRDVEEFTDMAAYYSGLEAEIAWHRGDEAKTIRLAERAIADLPKEEALFRARVSALAADAAWRSGDKERALAWYADVMGTDPGTLRRLGLRLPATVVDAEGTSATARATSMLSRSPRIKWAKKAFVVRVESDRRVCLQDQFGARVSCADADLTFEEGYTPTDYDLGRRLASAFHRRAFSMNLGLSMHDLNSLDGTTVIESEAAHDRMEQILDGI
jgi:tetratricopeptide (TPR) repeat protein